MRPWFGSLLMRQSWSRFARNRVGLVSLAFLLVVVFVALVAGVLSPRSPFSLVDRPFQMPSGRHPLGTDMLGRDVAAGLVYGARTSLLIGTTATLVAAVVGVLVGGFAGYHRAHIDTVLMRITEIFQTTPSFIFAILLMAILGASTRNLIIAIAVVSWPPMARLARGEVMAVRNREFVEAGISVGLSHSRVLLVHVLPNIMSPVIVTVSLMVATAILIESGLSFLGLGDPNVMSWGYMVGAAHDFLRRAWWLSAIPGTAIALTVLSINLIGDGLNDALNPRLRNITASSR
jgi:peptide/nickel transport system permease protein